MQLLRGAKPTAKHRIAATAPHVPTKATPPQFLWKPITLSMWGNDVFGDCLTAEECFAKACDGIDLGYKKAVTWARNHWVLNGGGIWEVLTLMQTQGIYNGDKLYCDGPFKYVDFTNAAILRNAIAQGPVKLGVAADQIENVVQAYGVRNGWVMTGFSRDTNLDHCTSLCGYGTYAYLAAQLGADPKALPAATPVYAMYTWSSIGIIDAPSLVAVCGEGWLRNPTTVTKPNPVAVGMKGGARP